MHWSVRKTVLISAVAAAAAACLATPASAVPGAVPPPASDPFYAVPPDLEHVPVGTVLRWRHVQLPQSDGPLAATAWQVLYRTTDNHWRPTATVETVLVPDFAPVPRRAARPLLSYQVPEDGLAQTCAPSYQLRLGTADTIQADDANIGAALSQGWTVVVPDYEGPNSEYLGASGTAHEVLDGIRAALRFGPAGVSRRSPIGLWGYSGGAEATALAAQAQRRYAPELLVTAIATGGLLADGNATLETLSGTVYSGDIPFALAALERSYPEAHVQQYMNATAQADADAVSNVCTTDAVEKGPFFVTLAQLEAYQGALTTGPFYQLAHDITPVGISGTPTAPVYDYHGTLDQLTPIPGDRQVMRKYCAAGAVVQHVESPADHGTEATEGAPGALSFLEHRFAGLPAIDTCATIPAP